MPKYFFGVAQGAGSEWDAFSLDFDLAVQGDSFDEVRGRLEEAITEYVNCALAEPPQVRRKLLSRKAPLHVRLFWGYRFLRASLSGREDARISTAGFPVPCHA